MGKNARMQEKCEKLMIENKELGRVMEKLKKEVLNKNGIIKDLDRDFSTLKM